MKILEAVSGIEGQDVDALTLDRSFLTTATLVIGVLLVVIAIFGCWAAMSENHCMIKTVFIPDFCLYFWEN